MSDQSNKLVLCPIALMAGCVKCPIVKFCPAKTIIGNYEPTENDPNGN